jgi:ABC-type transport system substrate-binding protein
VTRGRAALLVLAVLLTGWARAAAAQETPRHGGELVFVVPAEPPSFDGHREESFALIHPAAPHYNTLLRVDPDDPTGTKIVGDLAESWASARNGRTWTFNLRRAVKFHDGSELTARDVKASYVVVDAVDAPDASTVVFRLKWPAASFLASLASPFNWIYGRDVGAARTEARRLLKEAGVPGGFSFTFRNRAIRDPYESLGVWLVDQWRQIGLNVKVETLELATLYNEIRGGNFDVAANFHWSCIVEPDWRSSSSSRRTSVT